MAKQVQDTRYHTQEATQQAEELKDQDTVNPEIRANAEKRISELDALLDDIDDTLESYDQEFAQNYVQKGGE
jgi:ubiquitin-like protein Pup